MVLTLFMQLWLSLRVFRRFCREDLIWESVGPDERKNALPLYGGLNHVMFH